MDNASAYGAEDCRLAESGNNVTIYTVTTKHLNLKTKNVKVLESLIKPSEGTLDDRDVSRIFWYRELTPSGAAGPYSAAYEFFEKAQGEPVLERLLKTPYDVALVDETFTSFQGTIGLKLREVFGTRLIAFATTELMPVSSTYRGYSRNPLIIPNSFLQSFEVYEHWESFFGRVRVISDFLKDQIYSGPVASSYNERAGRIAGLLDASKRTLFQNSIITVNDYPTVFSTPSPIGNDLIPIGEYCHTPKPLPTEFRDFVEDPDSKGTIYVAFGSLVDLDDGPEGVVQKFVEALNHFEDYRVIWSYKGNTTCVKPHVKVTKWAPQNDILSHEKTKVFFTHGGLKSAKEGVCSEVPMLFLPFYGDQPRNAHQFIKYGIAESIYKHKITSEEIVVKLTKILGNSNYRKNVKKMKSFYMDTIMNPIELGKFHVERISRSSEKSYLKFKRKSIFQEYPQFLQLDIVFVIFVVVFIVWKL